MTSWQSAKKLILVFALLINSCGFVQAVSFASLIKGESDVELIFSGKFKPETFWGDNISLLNSNNRVQCKPIDRIFYARHTLDITLDMLYGRKKYDKTALEFLFSMRNKGIWGNPESIASTTDSTIKFLDTTLGSHRHGIPRHIFWIREAWMRFSLSEPVGFHFSHNHEFTIGIFSFQLGRGIALGDAYAVGPELLGFYTETQVDQFAPGARLSGDILTDRLSYELYAAILQNRSSTLGDTGQKIYGQEFGRRTCPARGFGIINYAIAGHLFWYVFDNDKIGSLTFEPYFLYNEDPEQRVQFLGDASSKLGTIGLAGEYANKSWEFGFDYAFNLGRQKVKGWDRNVVEARNRNGRTTIVNSHVFMNVDPNAAGAPSNLNPYKVPNAPDTITSAGATSSKGRTAQELINNSEQGEEFNGASIGTVPGFGAAVGGVALPVQAGVTPDTFFNANNRFRNPYVNEYEGWMFVADAAWWIYEKDLKLAATAGVASGDENPNVETKDGNFTGFIGLQEIYSGKRVRSAFALGGAGKLKRPLSVPESEQSPTEFSAEVNGFTNLVFTGLALYWTPSNWQKKFSFNPNVLAYWEQHPTKKFDLATRSNSPQDARTFLGVEVNSFIFYNILPDLKLFFVGSVFVPGGHYADIRGKPLNADQNRALDRFERDGERISAEFLPNIGTDPGVTLNFGLEYNF